MLGFIPGSIGETSVLAVLIGAVILLMTGLGSWRIMFSALVGGFFMASIFYFWNANGFMSLNPIHQLCIGGFMFAIVFMALGVLISLLSAPNVVENESILKREADERLLDLSAPDIQQNLEIE